jgi:hypothetical protein
MTQKQLRRQTQGLARRADRGMAHAALMEQHAARRAENARREAAEAAAKQEAIATYNRYWSAWLRGGCKGPKPVKPRFM